MTQPQRLNNPSLLVAGRSRYPSHAGQRVSRGFGLRAGVRMIPDGCPANRSLSAIEPVSATAKWKLENSEQRPAPETRPAWTEIPEIANQRPGRASLTRRNVAGSHTPGNYTPETGGDGGTRTPELAFQTDWLS
jgi:hypothetical protein